MCLIGSLRYRDSTSNTYNAFKCLKLRDIIKFKTCTHIFKADRNLLPPKLMERYRYVKHVHNYNTRNCGNIYQNIPKTFQKSRCPSIIGVKLYNQIPSHVRLLPSIISFKKRLKEEFLTKYKKPLPIQQIMVWQMEVTDLCTKSVCILIYIFTIKYFVKYVKI